MKKNNSSYACFVDYTKPVTNFRQLENGNNHGFWGNFIFNSNYTIQLAWDHVHFYHGYGLYWWTDVVGLKGQIYIDPTVLEPTRLYEVEYYSFTEHSNTYVYYFQLQGWLYGRGYGEKSSVLKTLKPYLGKKIFLFWNDKKSFFVPDGLNQESIV